MPTTCTRSRPCRPRTTRSASPTTARPARCGSRTTAARSRSSARRRSRSSTARRSGAGDARRAADAGAADAAVAVRVLRQVLLVVVLGEVEGPGRLDLGRDLARVARLVQRLLVLELGLLGLHELVV